MKERKTSKKKNLPTKGKDALVNTDREDPRWNVALKYRLEGHDNLEALVKAGFSRTYAVGYGIRKLQRIIIARVPEIVESLKASAVADYPLWQEIRRKAMQDVKDGKKWSEVSKLAGVAKQLGQEAGVVAPDAQVIQQTFQADEMKILIQQVVPDVARKPEPKLIEDD